MVLERSTKELREAHRRSYERILLHLADSGVAATFTTCGKHVIYDLNRKYEGHSNSNFFKTQIKINHFEEEDLWDYDICPTCEQDEEVQMFILGMVKL